MNFEHEGTPIACIKGMKKSMPILSVDDKRNAHHSFNQFTLKGDDTLQLIPNPESERAILYITGASGSGKSWFCREYVLEFKRLYPKREVYLFSTISEDSSIDRIKGLKRILLTPALIEETLTAEDFKESLVIFDDTDCITDKKLKLKVQGILNSILETGRHFKVTCLYTSHLPCAGNETKRILNESHAITFFPHSLGGRGLKYLLESYLGLDKKQIARIKQLPSRWVTVMKTYPQVVLSEKEAFLVSSL